MVSLKSLKRDAVTDVQQFWKGHFLFFFFLERAFSTVYRQENVELDQVREVHTLPIPFQNMLQMLFPLPGILLPMPSPLSVDSFC